MSRTTRSPASFDDADAGLVDVLSDLEGADRYVDWIVSLCAPSLRGQILEVGAGQGTYTERLTAFGEVTALEPSRVQHSRLVERLANVPAATAVAGTLDSLDDGEAFDAAVMINVLEHIEDDVAALQRCAGLLDPGGTMCIWVPAYELLYSRFDHEIGHFRRYRKQELVDRMRSAGFEVTTAHYANLPGFFAWLLIVRLAGRRPTSGRLATIYDRRFVPLIRRVESRLRPPFGQSLFAVGVRR
jgi:SAM-dependent methyltransferase